jgi:hypothetical protein
MYDEFLFFGSWRTLNQANSGYTTSIENEVGSGFKGGMSRR